MKNIKKLLTICLAVLLMLCMGISFVGCNRKIQFNTEYKYCGVTFKKDKDLTLEDLSAFIPPIGYDIKTVTDFEKMLKENIEQFSIRVMTENGIEVVYFDPVIKSIALTEDTLTLDTKNGVMFYEYTLNDNVIECDAQYEFYFEKGQFHYEIELIDKFIVVYNFKA